MTRSDLALCFIMPRAKAICDHGSKAAAKKQGVSSWDSDSGRATKIDLRQASRIGVAWD